MQNPRSEVNVLDKTIPDDKKYYTTGEVAEIVGVSVSTVWKWCKDGVIQAIQTPRGHYRIPKEEVEKLLQK